MKSENKKFKSFFLTISLLLNVRGKHYKVANVNSVSLTFFVNISFSFFFVLFFSLNPSHGLVISNSTRCCCCWYEAVVSG